MGFAFGKNFRIRVFGKSHGKKIGVVVSGVPQGIAINRQGIQAELDRRRPGQSRFTTQRNEPDEVVIESGIRNGRTTGAPIKMAIFNKDVQSKPYEALASTPRPGHADFTAREKYGEKADLRGGGYFSGRMTACFVMAGAIAKAILRKRGIKALAYIKKMGSISARELKDSEIGSLTYKSDVRCPDKAAEKKMKKLIGRLKREGDSVGAVIECRILNVPAGMGEPMFGSIESSISRFVFAIPATKGIEFGSGFEAARMRGSEHNDRFAKLKGKVITLSNNAGGILGGLANGMPIVFRVAFKPTSSIAKEQVTLNVKTGRMEKLQVGGRHDPCIAIRAVPVVESAAAICMADYILGDEK